MNKRISTNLDEKGKVLTYSVKMNDAYALEFNNVQEAEIIARSQDILQHMKKGNKGIKLFCKCGHSWCYTGNLKTATCNSCMGKVPVTTEEE